MPLCRSQLGGLPTPRTPAERIEDRVMTKDGRDVTAEYRHGAEQALHLARLCGCKIALLKERSPSCGSGTIYDGTFTGGLTAGDGVTAALLRENGITVYGESEIGGCSKSMASPWKQCFENQKPANRTVRRFLRLDHAAGLAVLLLRELRLVVGDIAALVVILHGGFDGLFGQHGAVQLVRGRPPSASTTSLFVRPAPLRQSCP